MTQSDNFDNRPAFQLKGGMVTATILEVHANNLTLLQRQLAEKVAQVPHLFRGSPLVLGLDKLSNDDGPLDLAGLVAICREQGMLPFAVRASRSNDIIAAQALSLTLLPATMRSRELEVPAAQPAPAAAPAPAPVAAVSGRPGKLVTQPVRSGQQIYAEGCDLIVLAPVSAGAEIIADGHIHCYGMLRGRALAGAQGDTGARVFCQQMEAELVAVAGRYQTAEQLRQSPQWGKGVCISLSGDTLNITALN